MPIKRLHTESKIFFSNPYMIRVQYGTDINFEDCLNKYRDITRRAYKLTEGTWGFSQLTFETIKVEQKNAPPLPVLSINGMNQNTILNSLFDSDLITVPRGYICFKDEADALQFRLSVDATSRQVYMWPQIKFTIHEYVEDDS